MNLTHNLQINCQLKDTKKFKQFLNLIGKSLGTCSNERFNLKNQISIKIEGINEKKLVIEWIKIFFENHMYVKCTFSENTFDLCSNPISLYTEEKSELAQQIGQ